MELTNLRACQTNNVRVHLTRTRQYGCFNKDPSFKSDCESLERKVRQDLFGISDSDIKRQNWSRATEKNILHKCATNERMQNTCYKKWARHSD